MFVQSLHTIKAALYKSALLVFALLIPALAFCGSLEEVPANEKQIGVRSASGDFSVAIKTVKSNYKANEAIQFKVKGSETFYLYLFNYIKESKQAVSILPNKFQTVNNIKYTANKWHTAPNSNLEFYSDRPGKERVIMIASKKYIDVKKLLNKNKTKSLGNFYLMEDPLQNFENLINETYNIPATKRINVRQSSSRLPEGMVIKELYLNIR